ncbi:MAG: hypothetical protein WCA82_13820 [Jiangellales bacterium]
MKDTLIRTGIATFAGLFAVGFLTVPSSTASTTETAAMKRDDKITLIYTLDDDDRDDDVTSTSRASKPSKASESEPSRVSHSRAAAAPPISGVNASIPAPDTTSDRDISRTNVSRHASADHTNDWSRDMTDSVSRHSHSRD